MLQIKAKLDEDSPSSMLISNREKSDLLFLKYSTWLQCKFAYHNDYFTEHPSYADTL